jgi:hypothetical protein
MSGAMRVTLTFTFATSVAMTAVSSYDDVRQIDIKGSVSVS